MVPINFGKHLTASEDTLGSVNFTYVALFQKGVDRYMAAKVAKLFGPGILIYIIRIMSI